MRRGRGISIALLALTNLVGVGAFLAPLVAGAEPGGGEAMAHTADAPILFALLGPMMLAVAVSEVRSGGLDARRIALLGVLAGLNAALRLPGGLAGANLMYFLPMVCGFVFGPGFGFLLGATSMGVSGVITGGVGPWLPFQMWALGWLGAGGALARPLRRLGLWPAVAGLAAYGWFAGLAFGAVTNLWFWPYLAGPSAQISWEPGIGAAEAARRYWRFYVATSLAWDSARALGNAVMVVAFGRPVVALLERFRSRLTAAGSFTQAPLQEQESAIPAPNLA